MYDLPTKRIKPDEEFEWTAPMIDFCMIENGRNEESIITGQVAAPAPPWRGQRADWVRPVRSQDGTPWPMRNMIKVVTVTKRHRCGKAGRGDIVYTAAGRYVDPGEAYSCPATRLDTRLVWEDHFNRLKTKVISGGMLPPWEFDRLSGIDEHEMMCT